MDICKTSTDFLLKVLLVRRGYLFKRRSCMGFFFPRLLKYTNVVTFAEAISK